MGTESIHVYIYCWKKIATSKKSMFGSLVLAIIATLLKLHRCGAVTSGAVSSDGDWLSILFLHGRCEGEGYSTEQLQLEVAARMAAEDVSACSEYPVHLTAIGTVSALPRRTFFAVY